MDDHDRQVKEAINHITKEMASEIYIDTDNVQKQARFEWDHSYEGFLHRKKIKQALNYIYGRENMNTPKNYHLTKSEYRYKLARHRADIAINEATYKIIDVIHDRYHDPETLKMLLRLEEELEQLKEFYIVVVNEYMDMCNQENDED